MESAADPLPPPDTSAAPTAPSNAPTISTAPSKTPTAPATPSNASASSSLPPDVSDASALQSGASDTLSNAPSATAPEEDALPVTVPPFKRGWAKGSRDTFFQDRTSGYTLARSRGTRATNDFLIMVLNDYCEAYTWWLEPPTEPTSEDLAKEECDLDAAELALKPAKLRRLKKGIRNMLDRLSTTDSPFAKMSAGQIKKDPVGSLIASIARPSVEVSRARTAYQLWSKSAFGAEIKDGVNKTVAVEGLNAKKDRIDIVAGNTKEAFLALPRSEREVWELKAQAEKKANSEQRQLIKDSGGFVPHSTLDPVAAQEVIDTMVLKLDPLLKSLSRMTGGNCHFYWAGPEPSRGGQVNVL
ncbi:hypothetical protein CYLTODRAFT_447884, partial [Cylindrobasidium torrendii FP15055 ss-10]